MNQTVNCNGKQLLQYHSHHTQTPVQSQQKKMRELSRGGCLGSHFGKLEQSFAYIDHYNFEHFNNRLTLRSETISGSWNPLKNEEKSFLFNVKAFLVLKIFEFLS